VFMLLGNCGLPQLVRVRYLIASVGVEIPKDIFWASKFGCSVMASAKSDSEAVFKGRCIVGSPLVRESFFPPCLRMWLKGDACFSCFGT
jgi:hypothetical protein